MHPLPNACALTNAPRTRAGVVHGIEKRTGVRGKAMWNVTPVDESDHQEDTSAFVHDCRKLFFAHIEVEGDSALDRDARRCALQMTPARHRALQPRSVVQVIGALHGACAAAPQYADLADCARTIVCAAHATFQAEDDPAPSEAPSEAPSSPPERRPRKGRRRGGADSQPSVHCPLSEAVYSPGLQPPQPGTPHAPHWHPTPLPSMGHVSRRPEIGPTSQTAGSVRDQLLELFEQLVQSTLDYLLDQEADDLARMRCLDAELEHIHRALSARLRSASDASARYCQQAKRWQAQNVRCEVKELTRLVGIAIAPLANRTCEAPLDKARLLANLKKQTPTAYDILRFLSTTGNERRQSRTVSEKYAPEQKLIDALVPWSILASVARPNAPIMDLPMRVVLHNLASARGAGRTELRLWSALHVTPAPCAVSIARSRTRSTSGAPTRIGARLPLVRGCRSRWWQARHLRPTL